MKWFKEHKKFTQWLVTGLLVVCTIYNVVVSPAILRHTIRVYVLDGVIMDSATSKNYITPQDVREKLGKSYGVGGLVLRINSPGGSVVASQEILAEIRHYKESTNIPVVVSMGEMAASGGYYISLGGDKIIADAGTLTGSIGVISEFTYTNELYKKIGLETEIVKSGKYKDVGHDFLTPDEKTIMQELSDNIYNQFVNEVAVSRNMEVKDVKDLATGMVYSGEQAKVLGLVDKVGTMQDAINEAGKLASLTWWKVDIKYPYSGTFGNLFTLWDNATRVFTGTEFGLSVKW